jgi:thiol-disulfide isomerase/thioredoxin
MKKICMLPAVVGFAVSIAFAGPGPGDPAPNFSLKDTALVNHSLTEFTGKVVVLNFWASW